MKNKLLSVLSISFVALALTTPQISAEETQTFNTSIASTTSSTYTDSFGDNVLELKKYNKEGELVEVSVEKNQMVGSGFSTLSTGDYFASSRSSVTARIEAWGYPQVRVYGNGFSDSYTKKDKKTKKAINKISVNTTLMMNGSVEDQKADSRKNSSFANASAKQQRGMIPTHRQVSRSSHVYSNTGTPTLYHSTEAKR